jgi:hypothetical protein
MKAVTIALLKRGVAPFIGVALFISIALVINEKKDQ